MKIKYKLHNPNCALEVIEKGDWIDLKASIEEHLHRPYTLPPSNDVVFDSTLIPLGISMELPKYFEANMLPRSSTYKYWNIIMRNSEAVMDHTYCGNNDIWYFPAIALGDSNIFPGDRICQFRIRPSQFAPIWVKIKWLFTNKIEFIRVDKLSGKNRGGIGSTGKN